MDVTKTMRKETMHLPTRNYYKFKMTHALLHLPASCCSSVALSPRGQKIPVLSSRRGLSLRKEQCYGTHLGNKLLSLAVIQQSRVSQRRSVTPFPGCATASLKMDGDGEYQGVVVAGTFDRLHMGHTQLLRKALSLVAQGGRLIVGISNGQLLARKSLKELIEPFPFRVSAVEQYLKELKESHGQSVDIRCLEIEEAVPKEAVSDPQLDCIVVSEETEVGAHEFNRCRVAMGLLTLKLVVIPIVHEDSSGHKCSSSSFRRQYLGTFIDREKGERLSSGPLVTGPYMVGLTGGIAAGKSYVRELLKAKGAVVLDCDALGHLSYIPGTPTYQAMVAAFGHSIVNPVDGQIDRQILGSVVFNDPNQMEVLKSIVWAAVSRLVAEKREKVAELGGLIFFAEAALLLEAHWEKEMHEIWVVVAPEDVARHRLMLRNKMSEEDATKRIRSQMSSEQRIALADVVIYNGWTKDETEEQIGKAWKLLVQRLSSKLSQGKVEDHALWVRWAGLMRRLCINQEVALKWWPRLKSSYREPWRHYHTFLHLQTLYDYFHEYAHFIAEPHVLQLATFFHKIVYHPSGVSSHENELSSAVTFTEFASDAGVEAMDVEKVKAFILFNRQDISDRAPVTGDLAFFLDFNLAVLGSGPKEYQEYKAKVRQEFRDYDDEHFQTLFRNRLQRFRSQKQIFHTSAFKLKYLVAAQTNLSEDDSLKSLSVYS